ncbi:MAG: ribosomal protein S18-alanine N-acetyltransferase [Halodesulfurarchaeum sp.]
MTTVESPTGGRIRQATQADLLPVLRIEREVFEHPWSLASFRQFLDIPGFLVMDDPQPTGTVGDDLAGYVVADTVARGTERVGHVKDLAVKPGRQGEGRGSALLERALSLLRSAEVSEVRLEVRPSNEAALGLYRRYGFWRKRRRQDYYPDGEDALILAKSFD